MAKSSDQTTEQSTPKFVLKNGHQCKEVFTHKGVKYYEFVDSNMAPCHRMFTAQAFYTEFDMRIQRKDMVTLVKAMREALTVKDGGSLDLVGLSKMILQIEERMEWIFEPETALKYASVIIFDENEDPYTYDFKYNMDVKIPAWKDGNLAGFFLSMPVKRLFPALTLSNEDLDTYLKTQEKVKAVYNQDISTILSSESKMRSWFSTLGSLKHEEQPSQK